MVLSKARAGQGMVRCQSWCLVCRGDLGLTPSTSQRPSASLSIYQHPSLLGSSRATKVKWADPLSENPPGPKSLDASKFLPKN